ncbi:MAG: cell division protein FtsZ [Bacteroidetes bacterium]|nr:MAG: cell division protein FtsZ [Bacteroidota bacterium]RLD44793.1 MAG: cell division protein FtsZ [Bacteroidota bacterium]RLD87569.1 MAG: cell division protein FtsZ [Bacteroidota bacterium]
MSNMITFEPKQRPSYIKVLGVGGGGSNAVNHMFKLGIKDVDFVICNTDVQALESSPVPVKIELGTTGLGAGSKPEVGQLAAEESIEKIKEVLSGDTQMLFITAGMGGGTGTGAAPVIARVAREMGILTVGIVTIPFSWEGRKRKQQAEEGIQEIREHVDTLLVISNDKLREQFGNMSINDAFAQADNVLTSAAKGIAELITVTGYINIDFQDVKTVIENSGKAIMGSATAEGEGRALMAIEEAMSSPLLDDNDIKGAQNILLYIVTGEEDLRMDEITEITDYIQQECGKQNEADVIWGNGKDDSLDHQISITIIATGFDAKRPKEVHKLNVIGQIGDEKKQAEKETPVKEKETAEPVTELIHKTEEETEEEVVEVPAFESLLHRKHETNEGENEGIRLVNKSGGNKDDYKENKPETVRKVTPLGQDSERDTVKQESDTPTPLFKTVRKTENTPPGVSHTISSSIPEKEAEQTIESEDDAIQRNADDRVQKLKDLSRINNAETVAKMESEPAYVRRNIQLDNTSLSSESIVSRYTLGEDGESNPIIKTDNSFLHDNVD